MVKTKELYIHSKCCNAHWEIKYEDGEYELTCEKCRKPLHGITVDGPSLEGKDCAECGSTCACGESVEDGPRTLH